MQIRVLGPMVVGGRDDLQLRDRAVLGVLVQRAGLNVSMDEVADALWGERPPATYKKVVQGCVVRLRKELGDHAIRTREGGYALALAADEVELVASRPWSRLRGQRSTGATPDGR